MFPIHPSACLDGCVCVSDMDKKLHLVKQSYQLWLLRGRYGEELWSWVHGQQERTHDLWHLPCWEGEMAAVLAFWLPSLQQWSLSPESKWSVIWPHPHVLVSFTLVLSPRSWLGYFRIHIRFHLLRMPFLELLGKAIWYPSSWHIWIFSITFLTALVLTWKSNPTVDAWPPALITSRLPTACLHPFWASQIHVRFTRGTPLLFYFVLPHFKLFG